MSGSKSEENGREAVRARALREAAAQCDLAVHRFLSASEDLATRDKRDAFAKVSAASLLRRQILSLIDQAPSG